MGSFGGKSSEFWDGIESFLGRKVPMARDGEKFLTDTSWVEGYVQDVLKKTMPPKGIKSSSNVQTEVFETHNNVIVRMKLPDGVNPRALQVFVNTNQIKIEGLTNNTKQFIKLPANVMSRSSKASYKHDVLQIQMRKLQIDKTYHEAYIRFP